MRVRRFVVNTRLLVREFFSHCDFRLTMCRIWSLTYGYHTTLWLEFILRGDRDVDFIIHLTTLRVSSWTTFYSNNEIRWHSRLSFLTISIPSYLLSYLRLWSKRQKFFIYLRFSEVSAGMEQKHLKEKSLTCLVVSTLPNVTRVLWWIKCNLFIFNWDFSYNFIFSSTWDYPPFSLSCVWSLRLLLKFLLSFRLL